MIIDIFSYLRFSQERQSQGASLLRQIEGTKKWLTNKAAAHPEHTYRLDESLQLRDLGISAFRGQNTTTGALSGFIKAVDDGRVSPGSFLVVESLDRISRTQVTTALTLFLDIIRKGITIVTMADQQEYSAETLQANPAALFMSIGCMMRAHEESSMKSVRVADAWRRKREAAIATGKALTRQCPAWLKVPEEVKSNVRTYQLRTDRVKTVQKIFELAADGWGQGRIAAKLTKDGVTPWGPGRRLRWQLPKSDEPVAKKPRGIRWHDSYVMAIMQSRAVLGELQLYTGDGKRNRTPVGEPIQNYYPAIIDPGLFAKVQSIRESRRIHGFVGREGESISNLFSGLVFDIKSRERCGYYSHSKHTSWQYLRPPAPEKGQKGWPYREFERCFLEHCRLLQWEEIFGGTNRDAANQAEREVEAAKAEVARLDASITRYTVAVEMAPDVKSVMDKLRSLEEARNLAAKALKMAETVHQAAVAKLSVQSADANRIKTLAMGETATLEARLRLREEIRRVVRRIDACFDKRRYMVVQYTNGASRYIRPTKAGVQIWDERECGFLGTPAQFDAGAGALPNDPQADQERTAL